MGGGGGPPGGGGGGMGILDLCPVFAAECVWHLKLHEDSYLMKQKISNVYVDTYISKTWSKHVIFLA